MGRKRGFTLIELLVVIAIIAILAAILFPVFARAREQARATSCKSNLKQISMGVLMYMQDYDEFVPFHRDNYCESDFGGVSRLDLRWSPHGLIEPYIKNTAIYRCPSDTGVRAPSVWPPTTCFRWSSYAYNRFDAGNAADAPFRAGGYNSAAFERPAELVMLMDNGETDTGFERNGPEAGEEPCSLGAAGAATVCDLPIGKAVPTFYGGPSSCSVSYQSHYRRHNEGLNIAFFDGHVKYFRHGAMNQCPYFRERAHP